MNIKWRSNRSHTNRGFLCHVKVAASPIVVPPPPANCRCGIPNRLTKRIVDGDETDPNEYPWVAAVVVPGSARVKCAGTIINSLYVLTTAGCTYRMSPGSTEVLIKTHLVAVCDGHIRKRVQQIINHPSYTYTHEPGYDFSLLKLSSAIAFPADNSIAPACLPTSSNLFEGAEAIVSGWGDNESYEPVTALGELAVTVLANSACSSFYNNLNSTMLCAGLGARFKGFCDDSRGNPLVSLEQNSYSLVGMVSWVRDCSLDGSPGVYARVTVVLPWIRQNSLDGQFCSV